jgi:hypothetical protein
MKGKSVQVLPITHELTDEVSDLIADRLVHEVHTSERKSFRGCRRRWNWVFQQFYYPQVTAKPLEFGVAFHSAMEVLYDPDTWTWDRELILNAAIGKFADVCNEQKTKFLKDGIFFVGLIGMDHCSGKNCWTRGIKDREQSKPVRDSVALIKSHGLYI